MEVTEVRIKLAGGRDEKLMAFCTVTFGDCFVVRDIKVIRGAGGSFVAMPSRKLADFCPTCRAKNHLRARFCNECGAHLAPDRAERDPRGRAKLHADVAHPIRREYRNYLQDAILDAYAKELERSRQPGYHPPPDDFLVVEDDAYDEIEADGEQPPPPPRRDEHPRKFGEGILP